MTSGSNKFFKTILAACLAVCTILAATGGMDRMVGMCGHDWVTEKNEKYLQDSFDKSLQGFLVLSGVKSGLAIIEGSEVGVGFNLEIGDVVQSIYDFIDIAWRTALAGGTILLLMKLLLNTVELFDHWFLFTTLLLSFLFVVFQSYLLKHKNFHRVAKECIYCFSVFSLVLYIILPVSISGASYLSQKITQPLVNEARGEFETLNRDLSMSALNDRLFAENGKTEDSIWSVFDFKTKLKNSKDAFLNLLNWLQGITRDFAVLTVKFITGYIFDCLVFPTAFFIVVYITAKSLLAYLFGLSRTQTIQRDMEVLLNVCSRRTAATQTRG